MAQGVDSGAVIAASVFITIRILRPKWFGPKVVILSGVCCNYKLNSLMKLAIKAAINALNQENKGTSTSILLDMLTANLEA